MIPQELELTNFLSYRDTAVLEFDGIHLACISGLNGAGKSSILDGITWALFGQSRSQSDDDLVNRLAAIEGKGAVVRLTFSLEDSLYRVVRRKQARKRMLLELQIGTGSGQWKTLSEGKIRDTQAAIEMLLRMKYDTFINASFLLQGKADEFTTKTPNRRKEILADLLGLSRWDEYKVAATNRRKEAEGQLALKDGLLEEIVSELTEETERLVYRDQAQKEQEMIQQLLSDKEALLEQLRRAAVAVERQEQMVKNLAENLARNQRSLADLQRTRQQRQNEREHYQTILAGAQRITEAFVAWEEAEAVLGAWQSKAEAYHQLQQAKRPHELAVTQARSQLEQRQRELEKQGERAVSADEERQKVVHAMAAGHSQLEKIETVLARLGEQEQAWHKARTELQRLESGRQLLAQELDQLRKQASRIQVLKEERNAVDNNRQEAERTLVDLTDRIAALSEQNQQYLTGRAEADALQAEQPRLRQEMDDLRARIDQLDVETGGECPLCGQPLSDTHRHSVVSQLEGEGKETGDRFRANKEQIETLTVEVSGLEKLLKQRPHLERDQQTQQQRLAKAEARLVEIDQADAEWASSGGAARVAELEAALADESPLSAQRVRLAELATAVEEKTTKEEERQTCQRQVSAAEARLGELDRILAEWEESGEPALLEVKRRLEAKDYAPEAQTALTELEQQVSELAYDADDHNIARQTRDGLAEAPARHQELKQAEAALKPLEDMLADIDRQISDQEESVAGMTQQHDAAVRELESIGADKGDLQGTENEVFRTREEQVAANRRLGAAQQRVDVLVDLRARQQQLTMERAEVTQLISRLKRLEKSCGREGVQALLIEQALPDIEDRANELLQRLTGGDMRVSFETQKQLKSREATVETLDIRIVDSAGERPYANFSGGEQFRVNFAVRLALSQVLAKRAGARLQTLVIDEGFGSQDPNGRQRLVEAINTVRDDFARILVITHIDELRDAFPTRIEVVKGLTGSALNIS